MRRKVCHNREGGGEVCARWTRWTASCLPARFETATILGAAVMNTWKTIALGLLTGILVFSLDRLLSRDDARPRGFRPTTAPVAAGEPGPRRLAASTEAADPSERGGRDAAAADGGLEGGLHAAAEEPTDAAAAKLGALLAMPESYRNTTFLIAIRDAGFTCTNVIGVARGGGEVGAWRVGCDGAMAYWLGVDEAGRLVINPVAYGDSIGPQLPLEPAPVPVPAPER
jgi:hypothetical protein